jgi:hypothetical protein
MRNILLVVVTAVVAAACAPVQPVPVSMVGDGYDAANKVLAERFAFKLELPRDRWPTLTCDFNVGFSDKITWWRLCSAEDQVNLTTVVAIVTSLCYRPEIIEEKILKWYAGKWPYTILKKEVSENQGRVVTHYAIHHVDHQDFLSMLHIETPKTSLVLLTATGKDKHGREEDFRQDFELATKGVVISEVSVSGKTPSQ